MRLWKLGKAAKVRGSCRKRPSVFCSRELCWNNSNTTNCSLESVIPFTRGRSLLQWFVEMVFVTCGAPLLSSVAVPLISVALILPSDNIITSSFHPTTSSIPSTASLSQHMSASWEHFHLFVPWSLFARSILAVNRLVSSPMQSLETQGSRW